MRTSQSLRIGIVGSGMAGSAAAHFLRRELGDRVEIVVFERERRVGGRIREAEVGGRMVAVGASIAHSANRYFVEFARTLALHADPTPIRTLGVWNGRRFGFRTSGTGWLDTVRALGRYGLSPLRAERLVKQFVSQLVRVYDLLDQGNGFASPRELFESLGLVELANQPAGDYLRRNGVSDRFRRELVDGISRSNYLQGSGMHALVDLVSLAGGSMGGHLLSVREGNSAICRRLLETAEVALRTGAEVVEVARLSPVSSAGGQEPGFRITLAGGDTGFFDAVILAAPLELAGIRLVGMVPPAIPLASRPYHVTHVTFVVGQISPQYFGLSAPEQVPAMIMTEDSREIPFCAIGAGGKAANSEHTVYKVFSYQELDEEFLSRLFSLRTETQRFVWKAYPVYRPGMDWPPFVLDEGLFYANAMESGVSTMETEIMAGRNVVNLLLQRIRPVQRQTG
ncbi:MAG: FAD-dependent oxidoreductase [Bacillota bacterium]